MRWSDKIAYQPTAFQEFVEKRYELRITCGGNRCFPCRIEARTGNLTAEDYRFEQGPHPCGLRMPATGKRLQAYMKYFGLNFACFDIAITKTGEPIFFESNPNGQWLWVEHMTGSPIGEAIAGWLGSRR